MLQEKALISDSTKKIDASPQVSWAEDYLASTSLDGKVQLLKRQDTEDGEQIRRSLKHSPKFVDPSNAKP